MKNKRVKAIITKNRGDRIQIDLIIMKSMKNENNQFKYILTVIDLFSKYAWAIPLRSKKGDVVAKAIETLIHVNGIKPKIIQSDNGAEFKNKWFDDLCKDFNTKQVFSLPYAPQSQGQVERFNGILKNKLKQYFSKTGKHKWIDVLNSMVYNYNNTKQSTTDFKPSDVQNDEDKNIQVLSEIRENIEKKAAKNLEYNRNYASNLKAGDSVRISKLTSTKARRDKFDKVLENWSRDIYTIHSVSKRDDFKQSQYVLKDSKGDKINKKFYRDDLQLVDKDSLIKNVKSNKFEELLDEIIKPEDVLNLSSDKVQDLYSFLFNQDAPNRISEKIRYQVVGELKKGDK
jgi:transposase InsO family protein